MPGGCRASERRQRGPGLSVLRVSRAGRIRKGSWSALRGSKGQCPLLSNGAGDSLASIGRPLPALAAATARIGDEAVQRHRHVGDYRLIFKSPNRAAAYRRRLEQA
jgi:hypothetical protein